MKLLLHEGVVGSLKFSTVDKVFYGKIQGVKGVFSYHGETESEAIEAFRESVGDYTGYCLSSQIKPMNITVLKV